MGRWRTRAFEPDGNLRENLLRDNKLTLEKAFNIALAHEDAKRRMKLMELHLFITYYARLIHS